MSVQTDVAVSQGDVVHVKLQPDNNKEMVVEAIVWHVRRVRMRRTGTTSLRLGLILSEAPEAYLGLLESKEPAPPVGPSAGSKTSTKADPLPPEGVKNAAGAKKSKQPGLPKPQRFRVRVKQETNPRTRSILVFAESEDEARKSALHETGSGWMILEIDQA
jgi:hypothetical protein